MNYHIIGDIHGQADKLESLLRMLGYRMRGGVYAHADAKAVFLGDFIDRGPHQRRVIEIVRPMVESGSALAVMGNHEFNAIAYHLRHPVTKAPLRPHSERNTRQHRAFLREYEPGRPHTREVIDWFMSLPLYLEVKDNGGEPLFRVVHACWHQAAIRRVPQFVDEDFIVLASSKGEQAYADVETLLKGPEVPLPEGYAFRDESGIRRTRVRLKWWECAAGATYRDIAMVPPREEGRIPDVPVDKAVMPEVCYGEDDLPVFFGHYWLRGRPFPVARNLACMDYSAAAAGPLVAYLWRAEDDGVLCKDRFVATQSG